MILCKKCGQEIPAAEPMPILCPHCGIPLAEPEQIIDLEPESEETTTPTEPTEVTTPTEPTEPTTPTEPTEVTTPTEPTEVTEPTEPTEPTESEDAIILPETDLVDPSEEPLKKKNRLPLILGIVAVAVVLCLALFATRPGSASQTTDASQHANPTSLRYVTADGISLVQGSTATPIFVNDAADLNSRASISQILLGATPTINSKNYVTLDNGDTVVLETNLTAIGPDGQPTTAARLMLYQDGAEPTVLEESAQFIYCNNGTSLFYNKIVDEKMVQYRYQDGQTTPVDELIGEKNSMVFQVSDDSSLLAVSLFNDDFSIQKMGYRYNNENHFLEDTYQVFSITEDGKNFFVVTPDPESNLVTLFRVKDFATGELEQLGAKVSKIAMYDEDGSLSFIGDCNPAEQNLAGSIYYFDATANTTTKMADHATSIFEAYPRNFGWFNENATSVSPTEYAPSSSAEKTLFKGQIHYLDTAGDLKVIKLGSTPGESGLDGLLLDDGYAAGTSTSLPSLIGDSFYWSKDANVYRYKLGSLAAPQVLALGESLNDKATNQAQMGYIVTGSGAILEETGNALVLKKFDEEGATVILEEMGQIRIIGLDNKGTQVYFISEDHSLYSKSLEGKGNPKLLLTNVTDAVATTSGLYALQNYDPTAGGTLSFLHYGDKTPTFVSEGILGIQANAVS